MSGSTDAVDAPPTETPDGDAMATEEGINEDDGESSKVKKVEDSTKEMMETRIETEERVRSHLLADQFEGADPKDYGIEVESDDEYKYRKFYFPVLLYTVD